MERTSYIPQGYHKITPSLTFKGTESAMVWYKNVFGAEERMRMEGPDKKIVHAELNIGDSMIFLAEENPKYMNQTPQSTNGNSVKLHVYVEDVDGTLKKAVQNGATLVMPAEDQFYGDRCGWIEDPFGYTWVLATHIKDISEEEMHEQMEEMSNSEKIHPAMAAENLVH